jgi:hypothetical protein
MVFENRLLRKIYGPTRDEVTGSWRKLHNEELHNLYSSPNIIRKGTSCFTWVSDGMPQFLHTNSVMIT